jgi:2-polyprenyl-3-methyl-5-hydroxy-6-metoxy-1,4-benzoquinol methylase
MLDQETLAEPIPSVPDIRHEIERRVPLPYGPLPLEALHRHESELAYRQDFLDLAAPLPGPGIKERVKAFAKRVGRLALRWVLIRQVEFNQVLLQHVRESTRLLELLDSNMAELFATVAALKRQVEEADDKTGRKLAGMDEKLGQADRRLSHLNDMVVAYRVRLRRLAERAGDGAVAAPDAGPGYTAPPVDYLTFENHFRGAREQIRERQRNYLEYFQDVGKVLDVGCGRGEFVELLASEGLEVHGIDANRDMADFCKELGLPVTWDEGMRYLDGLEDESVGGVFTAQVVEHMPPEAIVRLIGRCWAKLQKGGVLVVETVNPVCPIANGNFYLDPTHVRPVHAELLRFLVESQGFTLVEYVFSAPVYADTEPVFKTLDNSGDHVMRFHDYAVVARK